MSKAKRGDSLSRFSIEQLTSPYTFTNSRSYPSQSSSNGLTDKIAYSNKAKICEDSSDKTETNRMRSTVCTELKSLPTSIDFPSPCGRQQGDSAIKFDSIKQTAGAGYTLQNGDVSRTCVSAGTSRPNSELNNHINDESENAFLSQERNVAQEPDLLNFSYDRNEDPGIPSSSEDESNTDATDKPTHSYIALISTAILDCPEKKLVLSDIYQYIMDKFPYYNNQERAWRNSIRHNLSLNECFIKAGRAENGKGNYWSIHPACIEDFSKGDYRRRHARRRARGSAYADINVSSLPFNYRYNIGYVPMTPSPVIGYPYPIPYLPHAPATLLQRGIDMSAMASMASLVAQQKANISTFFSEELKKSSPTSSNASMKINSSQQQHLALMAAAVTSTPNQVLSTSPKIQPPPLLSPPPLHSVLSPPIPYSPYSFPFM